MNARASELRQGAIRSFFDKAAGVEDVISLGIGEPDFPTPRALIDESYRRMLAGDTHYTQNAGLLEARRAAAVFLARYGVEASPETEIIMTPGGMGALSLALLCLLDDNDEVLIQDPQWLNYRAQVQFCGATAVPVPVFEEDGFRLKAETLERYVTNRTKILMINSPNNPTGAVLDADNLAAIAKFAIAHDLFVISDEVYSGLLYDGEVHRSIASVPSMRERTLVVNSFSKLFAMTGWRLGFASGNAEIIRRMVLLQENLSACAPSPAQAVAQFALSSMCGTEEMREIYRERRDFIVDGLNSIRHIRCQKPRGSFYVFPNIKDTGLCSEAFADALLERAKVVTIAGTAFGEQGEGYLRVSYANSKENIARALERIDRFTAAL